VGVVLPFRRPEPRRSQLRQAHPVEDPYWLADALHLRAAEAWELHASELRPDRPERGDD